MDENMSNLTSASGEAASVSSGNRTEIGTNYPSQYFAPPPQTQIQPPLKKKRNLPGNPDPDAEVIALSPKTLMATNRFICEICNKGFQRDQNLQLHRRGHNLPWKLKQRTSKEIKKKVYVCPETSCVHHDPSRALGDLTGIKKHFCRKHGEKKWKCDKCSKRYAVQSDWKAHSKTCGTREYRCDCGTLFSRRDSFITHRAFCDALAEESARAISANPVLLSSQQQQQQHPGGASSTSHMNLQIPQFNHPHHHQELHGFALKKENFSSLRPEIPPWLAFNNAGPPPPHLDISSSSSIFSTTTRLDQDLPNIHETHHPNPNPSLGPTLPPYQPTPSPHMSATALLQKAAQMGATMSSKTTSTTTATAAASSSSSPSTMIRAHHQPHVSSSADHDSGNNNSNGNFGLNLSSRDEMLLGTAGFAHGLPAFGNNKAATISSSSPSVSASATTANTLPLPPPPPHPSLLHDMMNSLSSGTGFEGTCFEDAFSGILSNSKKLDHKTNGGGDENGGSCGGDQGLTRDFLGLRALSHSDIMSFAGLGNCMNTSREHENQTHKPWQG
ncbi:protein indeterminate-domain 7 isoform X2 [Ziziphus jujuba]|nr:protein indeterminate-domain 7 isoform X2 [Ziziphus jujuba]XP_015890706.2 protein indeterminate-domain 7 isoform X2 [Ziziphus jujuba]